MRGARATIRTAMMAGLALLAAAAPAQNSKGKPLPRADFFEACPFTVAPPSVVAVLDATRWRNVVAASRATPAPYDASATDFKRESIFIVALPNTAATATEAALSSKKGERYDEKTGTLTLYYDVSARQGSAGDVAPASVGQPCLVTWTAARKDLQQVITRTTDGHYIAGTRTAEKAKKKK